MRLERSLLAVGVALTFVGLMVPPLLILAVPFVLVAGVLMVKNFRVERRWTKDYRAAYWRAWLDPSGSSSPGAEGPPASI
jgi:cytochrome c oxidase assembly factor CtaG